MTHKQEDNYNCRDFPPGKRVPGPVSGSLAWGSCTEKSSLALEATGLTFGQESVGNKLPSQRVQTKFHTLAPRARSSNLEKSLALYNLQRKETFILYINTCIYTSQETKRFVKQSVLPSYFLSMLFSQNPNAVNCPLH